MQRVLFGYGMRLFDALAILLLVIAAAVAACQLLRRGWQAEKAQLLRGLAAKAELLQEVERQLAEERARQDPARLKALREELQSAVAHEFVKGLNSILAKGQEVLDGLAPTQIELRDRQSQLLSQGYDLLQRTQNIVGLFGLGQEELQRELINPRGLVEAVLKELFPYAETRGVVLRPSLASLEPVSLHRHLIAQALSNVVHNAIKYSPPGAVVDVELGLSPDAAGQVSVVVRDRGRGIPEGEQESLFSLHTRGDGLVQPGSGLGLYYAREAARLHGGDLVLVESHLNQGSTFRLNLPYR